MRVFALVMAVLTAGVAQAAETAERTGAIAVGPGAESSPLMPWLALSALAMIATLIAAHVLVNRGPRR